MLVVGGSRLIFAVTEIRKFSFFFFIVILCIFRECFLRE